MRRLRWASREVRGASSEYEFENRSDIAIVERASRGDHGSQLRAGEKERWSTARDMILLRRHVYGGHCVKYRAPFDQLPRASVAIRSRTTRIGIGERKAPRSTKGRRSREGKKLSLGGFYGADGPTDRDRVERERRFLCVVALAFRDARIHVYVMMMNRLLTRQVAVLRVRYRYYRSLTPFSRR